MTMTAEMDKATRAGLIKKGNQMDVTLTIGKGGLGGGVTKDAAEKLKARGLIKVKVLPKVSRDEVHRMAGELSSATGSTLLDVRGRTFLLYRQGSRRG